MAIGTAAVNPRCALVEADGKLLWVLGMAADPEWEKAPGDPGEGRAGGSTLSKTTRELTTVSSR